ncbi:pilus assembly protein PilP [Alteromonas sp. D210916BOD_24]|uniref:pilus assembly protein PilP n=1 Tax=Alteromonas sp. D210916BOD_24 TaxID=3157618 RepID=UPI00399C5888
MRYLLIVTALAMLTGCSPHLEDLHAYTQSVKARTTSHVEPYPEFKTHPPFSYSASALRSPFAQPVTASAAVNKPRVENCYQPDFQRPKAPLEAYGLDALTLTGNFEVNKIQWALLQSNDGVLHKAKVGDHIGLFYGTITQIRNDSIIIEQSLPDGAGCWQRKTTTMTTASKAGE